MNHTRVTDDFYLGMELPESPAMVRAAWITALREERFTQGRMRCLAYGNERCVFGVLCEVCQDMGLISMRHYEWEWELPPYSVCMLAGVRFNEVRARQAMGLEVDSILTYADRPGRTQREIALAIEQRFEGRDDHSPCGYAIEYEATPGLGGNGFAEPGWANTVSDGVTDDR